MSASIAVKKDEAGGFRITYRHGLRQNEPGSYAQRYDTPRKARARFVQALAFLRDLGRRAEGK